MEQLRLAKMMDSEIRIQLQNDIHELELIAGEYPHDCPVRYVFLGFAEMLKKSFELTEDDKQKIVKERFADLQPCTQADLVQRLPFVRAENRHLVELFIAGGMVETYEEPTEGRPIKMLRLP